MKKQKPLPPEIHILNKRLRLRQPPKGFRTSLDSVMLAAACPVKKGQSVLDMGCGVGSAGFCVLERVAGTALIGVEIQKGHVKLAEKNAALNNMQERAGFIHGDIRKYESTRFDHVICNPPYLDAGTHMRSPSKTRATALYNDEAISVKDWVDAGFKNLKSGGGFTMIHRADHVDKIIAAFGKRFGAVEIIPLWPRQGAAAKRVIVRALKDRRTPASIHPGIVLHKKDGGYTKAADDILRRVKSIS